MRFHTGTLAGEQTRDESGVAAAEFIERLDAVHFERIELARAIGMDEGQLSTTLGGNQKWISLKVADRILMALGRLDILRSLTIIPGHLRSDAVQMAVYENLNDDDELQVSLEEIADRAEELEAIREMMLSGDAEIVAAAQEIARG